MKKKIALIAYACSPMRGSEYSVSWNYITEMYGHVDIDVYLGAAGEHMGDFNELEMVDEKIFQNVNFIKVNGGWTANTINILNKKNILGYAFYVAYKLWHEKAFKEVDKRKSQYDAVHFLCPHGYRVPGRYYDLGIKSVWGPVGGFGNASIKYVKKGRLKVIIRTLINEIQKKFDRNVKKGLITYDTVFASNSLNKNTIKEISGRDVEIIPENGIINKNKKIKNSFENNSLSVIWIGSIDERKSLNILLEACIGINIKYHLHIVGNGKYAEDYKKYAEENKINTTFYGAIKRSEVQEIFQKVDVHVITSLLEGNPTVLWEAMSEGIPTISLANSGMVDTICEKCGILINMVNYEQVVVDLKSALTSLQDISALQRLTLGVCDCREKFLWKNRISTFLKAYH
jgi:glycosyltransferase involved in cell wall biosynthesis